MLINALCGHQAEFGIIAPAGQHRVGDLVALIQEEVEAGVPKLAREASLALIAELQVIEARVGEGRSCSGTTAAHAGRSVAARCGPSILPCGFFAKRLQRRRATVLGMAAVVIDDGAPTLTPASQCTLVSGKRRRRTG